MRAANRRVEIDCRRLQSQALRKVQRGLEPDDWRPMKSVGVGVREIRVREKSGAFRVIYYAKLGDAVYVLHCFQKKTPKTSRDDIRLARTRFKELTRKKR